MIIEICGMGCARCNATKNNVVKAWQKLGLKEGEDGAVTEVKDPRLMAARGVMLTPAVVIDGVKVCEGRVPSPQEVTKWVEERK